MRAASSVVLFFVDGLGIGSRESHNPLFSKRDVAPLAHFEDEHRPVFLDGIVIPTDACLGVRGRPQSASGQTTILTGMNAPLILGRHKHGFPNEPLRQILREFSIFERLKKLDIGPNIFANAYTPGFFESGPRWKSATTIAVEAAGLRFRRLRDLIGGKAVYHDFSNLSLIEKGLDVPEFSPEKAGGIIAALSGKHRFVLYEHFITDKIGHEQDHAKAEVHLPRLARMLRSLLGSVDKRRTTVFLTSDHGNIENLSVRNHTLNKVPTVIWGRRNQEAAGRIADLTDLVPAFIDLLSE